MAKPMADDEIHTDKKLKKEDGDNKPILYPYAANVQNV